MAESKEYLTELFYIMFTLILFLKFIFEAWFEKVNPAVGHNTGVIVLIGILCSFAIYKVADDEPELLSEL